MFTKNIPPSCHSGGLFWHCFLGIAVLTDYSFPSSHLQISSTNKPAVTDTKNARNISNMFTSLRQKLGGNRQAYYITKYCICQFLSTQIVLGAFFCPLSTEQIPRTVARGIVSLLMIRS